MKCKDIQERLVQDIAADIYTESGKLPSESALSASFGVSRMTLRVALDNLRRQGLIEKRNGAGSFLTKRAFRSSRLIGLVIPDYEDFNFFSEMRKEVERHASLVGYRISLVFTRERRRANVATDIRRKVRELAANRAEGVIFRPFVAERMAAPNREIVRILGNAEIPVVLIDSDIARPPKRSGYDLVAINNVGAGRQIADHLHERGYKRIAFLMEDNDPFTNANWGNRLFGLAGELALLGCEENVRQLDFRPSDAHALGALFRSHGRPDAIVCGNDEQAALLIQTLARLGKRVPTDVAVVGFDDIPLSRATTPPLTTISQPVKRLAATAFKALLARIRYPNSVTREILLDTPLVEREST